MPTSDAGVAEASLPMAVMIASGGICAALLSSWTLRAGLTRSIATGEEGLFSSVMRIRVRSDPYNLAVFGPKTFFMDPDLNQTFHCIKYGIWN